MAVLVCGIIPVYNNQQTIAVAVAGLLQHTGHVIVVDDGSNDGTAMILDQLAAGNENIDVLHLPYNQGKGAAVQRGLAAAQEKDFTYAVQIDADGQHNLDDIPHFMAAALGHEGALVVGLPIFDDNIPFIRKHGRKLTNYMMALEMGMFQVPDGNCGFRAYPVQAIAALGKMGNRMNWDPEVLVRASWAGIPIIQVPTKVRYPSAEEGGVSHFRMVHDNLLHTWLHMQLLVQAPWRLLNKWFKVAVQ